MATAEDPLETIEYWAAKLHVSLGGKDTALTPWEYALQTKELREKLFPEKSPYNVAVNYVGMMVRQGASLNVILRVLDSGLAADVKYQLVGNPSRVLTHDRFRHTHAFPLKCARDQYDREYVIERLLPDGMEMSFKYKVKHMSVKQKTSLTVFDDKHWHNRNPPYSNEVLNITFPDRQHTQRTFTVTSVLHAADMAVGRCVLKEVKKDTET